MFQSNGGEEGEVVGDRHGWERKMVRGERGEERREERKGGRYDTEPYSGMEELNHAPSNGRRKTRPTRET